MVNSRCGLPFQVFLADLSWRPVLKPGVPAFWIVPEFNVPHNVPARVLTGRILGTVNALVLQSGEERLRHRIIVTYPGAPDGMPEAIFLQRAGELLRRVIAAAVGVENSMPGEREIAGSHLDGLLDERRLVVIARSPADYFFCMAVDDRRQVKPALPRRDVRNIADHFHAGRVSSEIAVHQIRDVVLLAIALSEAEPPRPRLAGLPAPLTPRPPRPGPEAREPPAGTRKSHPIHRMTSARSKRVLRAFSQSPIPAHSAIHRIRTWTPPSTCTF